MSRTPARKPAAAKRKPATKKKKKKKPPPKPKTRVRTPQAAAAPVETSPAPARPATSPSNGLAVASIVSAFAGMSFVPIVGGFVATILGALAIKQIREDPEHYTGKGLAVAGLWIGLLTSVLPLAGITLFMGDRWTVLPFVAIVGYGAFIASLVLRKTSGRQKLAILGGSVLATAIAIGIAIGLAFLFYFAIQALFVEVGSAIGDAFSEMFDGIGDAFGSCGDAFN